MRAFARLSWLIRCVHLIGRKANSSSLQHQGTACSTRSLFLSTTTKRCTWQSVRRSYSICESAMLSSRSSFRARATKISQRILTRRKRTNGVSRPTSKIWFAAKMPGAVRLSSQRLQKVGVMPVLCRACGSCPPLAIACVYARPMTHVHVTLCVLCVHVCVGAGVVANV